MIDLDPKNKELIKPILRGKDLERYGAKFKDIYLLCAHNGVKSENIRQDRGMADEAHRG